MKQALSLPILKKYLLIYLEWLVIIGWAIWVGRNYLDLRLTAWPSNVQEYIMSMQNQYVWTLFQKCGACFYWNGFTNGGAPAFVDLHSAWLHPLTAAGTFMFGVFNSGKMIVIASLAMAGVAQWWFGKIMNLSLVSRMWTALLVVSSGALSGRMQVASVPLVVSTAACLLVIPPAVNLALRGGLKNTIATGLTLGLALLAGQGYLQIGLLVCMAPMIFWLLMEPEPGRLVKINPTWRSYLIALGLAFLVAAPLLVPFIHFYPNFSKDFDPAFSSSQPVQYALFNLVINDVDFYLNPTLGKTTFPYLYINYIGWIAIAFAAWGAVHASQEKRKVVFGSAIAITLVYLMASADLFRWLSAILPVHLVSGVRNPSLIQGLAVTFILLLAGIGSDVVLHKNWPSISLIATQANLNLGTVNTNAFKWLAVLILMASALKSTSEFAQKWLYVTDLSEKTFEILKPLVTVDAQWVQPPWGEYYWFPAAMEHGLKVRSFYRPWKTTMQELPSAYLELTRGKEVNQAEVKEIDGEFVVLQRPQNLYASVAMDGGVTACQATSQGGVVDVICDAEAGVLTVLEHPVSGWNTWVDGEKAALLGGPWLSVKALAGRHTYTFRYQPWDVPLGIGLACLGWLTGLGGLAYLTWGKKAV